MGLSEEITTLFILALPVSAVAWVVTHEEIFREPREFCLRCSKEGKTILARKFFYLFTCEYCFSHYVTILFLFLTRYKLLYEGWRGYVIAGFSIVWIANIYMSLYNLLRTDLKKEKTVAQLKEDELKNAKQ